MEENLLLIIQLCIYLMLIPLVAKALFAIDWSKFVHVKKVQHIRILFILTMIAVTKVVGDLIFFVMTIGINLNLN